MTRLAAVVFGVAAVALAILFGWRGAQPFDPRRGPRLVPYRFLMMLCATAAILALGYLAAVMFPSASR